MRMFALVRSEREGRPGNLPLGRVAVGIEFDDGQVWVRILKGQAESETPHVWRSLGQALEVHNHFNDCQVRFL
jgi:hypothetical protein